MKAFRFLGAAALTLVTAAMAVPAGAAGLPPTTGVLIVHASGDKFMVPGRTAVYVEGAVPNGVSLLAGNVNGGRNGISLFMRQDTIVNGVAVHHEASLRVSAPDQPNAVIANGWYRNTTRFPSATNGGLDFEYDFHGCNNSVGRFHVAGLKRAADGHIQHVVVKFSQSCAEAGHVQPAVTGEFVYNGK